MDRARRTPRILVVFGVVSLLVFPGGCANKPSEGYFFEWLQPQDPAGQACVAACSSEKWQCGVRSSDKAQLCAAEQQAQFAECEAEELAVLENCFVDLQLRFGALWEEVASTCNTGPTQCTMPACGFGQDCEAGYEQCFFDCGGDIIEHGTPL